MILPARLAGDLRFSGKGLGHLVGWYARYGFIPIEGAAPASSTQRMFLDVHTLRDAAFKRHIGDRSGGRLRAQADRAGSARS